MPTPNWRLRAPAGLTLAQARSLSAPRTTQRATSSEVRLYVPNGGGYYEALRESPDRTPMRPATLVPGMPTVTPGLDRVRLAALSRALYDNGGFVGLAINQIAFYSAPVLPQATTADPEWNSAAEEYFADWSARADFAGRSEMQWGALQQTASQALDLDGDLLAVMTAEAGFPQIQLVDGWRISTPSSLERGEGVVDGVKIDAKGRVLGYYVTGARDSQLVPTGQAILLRDPSAASPLRGLSPLRRGMNDIRDARDILAFAKLAEKHASSLLGVIEGGPLDDATGFQLGGDPQVIPGADPDPTVTEPGEKTLRRQDLLGGDIQVMDEGRTFKRIEAQSRSQGLSEFQDILVAWFSAGLDIPPAFFLDAKLTGPNLRAVLGKAQRKFNQRQMVMANLTTFAWVRVIGHAIDQGILEPVDGWQRCGFQFPARLTIDAGREAAQDREDFGKGLMTRQEHYGARSRDWQKDTDQSFAEDDYIIAKAKDLATRHGIPVESVLERYGFAKPTPKPTTTPPE